MLTALTTVDFPQPDSPAKPRTSPLSISNDTPRTAGISPAWCGYISTSRSRDEKDAHRSRKVAGFMISSRANPHSVNASTTNTMARPGGTIHHH